METKTETVSLQQGQMDSQGVTEEVLLKWLVMGCYYVPLSAQKFLC